MNSLVYLSNNTAMTDSLDVADHFHKRHTDVLRKIETIIANDSTQNCVQCFTKAYYHDASGKKNIKYTMNRDGFTFLVMGFTGKQADKWKWDYIEAFNAMDKLIQERMLPEWIEARSQSKITRKAETDMIKQLIEYAKNKGSRNADKYYILFTKLANKFAQITNRDEASVYNLRNLSLGEHIILHVIDKGLCEGKDYHDIYRECKQRLETISDLAFISESDKLTCRNGE